MALLAVAEVMAVLDTTPHLVHFSSRLPQGGCFELRPPPAPGEAPTPETREQRGEGRQAAGARDRREAQGTDGRTHKAHERDREKGRDGLVAVGC